MSTKPPVLFMPKYFKVFILMACFVVFYFATKFYVRSHEFDDTAEDIGYSQFFSAPVGTETREKFDIRSWPDGERLCGAKCERCAYVTGSGHLLGSNKGHEIDRHDCVLRSNDAPVRGYETDVGRKTTIRTVNQRSLGFILHKMNRNWWIFDKNILKRTLVIMMHDGYARKHMETFHTAWPTILLGEHTPEKFRTILEVFRRNMNNKTDIWISNAFYTLQLARDICNEINVYGIASPEYCSLKTDKDGKAVDDIPYHYYENIGQECDFFSTYDVMISETHWFSREKRIFRSWIKEWPHLRFHNPEWT